METQPDGFFSKDNLYRAGWTAMIGVAGFAGALAYYSIFGAQRVVIETPSTGPSAARVVNEAARWPTGEEIRALAEAIRSIREAPPSDNDSSQLQALSEEVSRLREQLVQAESDQDQSTLQAKSSPLLTSAGGGQSEGEGPSRLVSFALPANVGGYTQSALIGVKDSTCPAKSVAPHKPLVITFNMVDTGLIPQLSPVRVTVVRERSATDFLRVVDSYSHVQPGANTLTLSPDLSPGTYRLTYGFYLLSELTVKFPNFYSRECRFEVQPA